MRTNNKIRIMLICLATIMLAVTIYEISLTYAVFHSEITGKVTQTIGKWKIKINNTDVLEGTLEEFTMNQFVVEQNDNTKPNKMAPGTTGTFEVTIDPTNTQVSVRYDISIDLEEVTNSKVKLVSVEKENNTNNQIIKTDQNTFTGIIPLEEINKGNIETIKIKFYWENDEENNEVDSEIGTILNSKIQIPIKIDLSQYLGEEIKVFSEENIEENNV